jgi:hypothetical protein
MRRFTQGFACLALLAAASLVVTGCGETKTPPAKDIDKRIQIEKGPHGGPLVVWGTPGEQGSYRFEFTVDKENKKATIYVLDKDGKNGAPIDKNSTVILKLIKPASEEIALKAEPDAGDPEGKSSRFVGTHDKLGENVTAGAIKAKIGETEDSAGFIVK